MIVELKKYVPHPGKAEAMHERFATTAMPILRRVGVDVMHCWTCTQEPGVLYYMSRFSDEDKRQAAWSAFGADAQWKAAKAASEVDGPLLASQTTTLLEPTRFSPSAHD